MVLEFNSLTDFDIANICLQRTGVLFDYSDEGREAFNQWHNHNKLSPLLSFIENNPDAKQKIILDWATSIYKEYEQIKINLPTNMGSVCDIGCGYGIFDLFLYNDYGSSLTLIDIELTKIKRHLFHEEIFSGYSCNVSTYNFLSENKVSKGDITMLNPVMNELPANRMFDLILSNVSLGFHYPLGAYEDFISNTLKIGGNFMFDHRMGFDDITDFLKRFEDVKTLNYNSAKFEKIYCNGFLG